MKPLNQDLSIYKKFNFERVPVGIKFEFYKPEGIEPLNKSLALCEMIKEAQETKAPFYMIKEHENCFGTLALGMEEAPMFAESGQIGEKLELFQEPRANANLYNYLPTIPKGTINYVVFSSLDSLTFNPDILFIVCAVSQAEIILRAMSYSTGEIWDPKGSPALGCSWLFAHPYKNGKVNYTITGLAFGMKAKQVFPESLMLISIPYQWIPTITQNLEEMKWDLPSYSDGRDKFLERESRIVGELVASSENP